ncbi:MAG: type III-A CRISPR-associated protein Cas10/Csm1 [Bacillota bacterium]
MVYETLVLSGLLHDIGKFLQKGSFGALNTKGKHPEVSSVFIKAFANEINKICDVKLLEILVMKHHESISFPEELRVQFAPEDLRPFAYLVSRADNYSSSERGEQEEKYQDFRKKPLDSIFSRLSIDKPIPQSLQYKTLVYSPENAFPIALERQYENDINFLLKSFGEEFKTIASDANSFDSFYNQLFSLLQKYTWCIPSNSQEKIADISLFDHLKTTSAITACLYQYHESINDFSINNITNDNASKFLLLVGDISGIQNYIFSGSQIGAGAVAKRLRARSFFLSMLSELVTHHILLSFNLPIANNLMASGGKFYILLPNLTEVKERLGKIQRSISNYLLKEYRGELGLNIVWKEMSGKDFENFGSILNNISKKLAAKKKMPFAGIINDKNNWIEEEFIINTEIKQEPVLCKGCGKEFAEQIIEDREYGKHCMKDLEIGRLLPRVKCIEFTFNQKSDIQFLDGTGLNLNSLIPEKKIINKTFILNDNKIYSNVAAVTKYICNYVPTEEGQTISFDQLIEKGKGIKRLAYLKADVDNLGSLFAFGLKNDIQNEKNHDSISRITTFSRMLDVFFSGRINELLYLQYQNCYTVYSGGDDLLLIGPWNEIIDLSLNINDEFKKFVGFNENITLSAGISMAKNRTPIVNAVDEAEKLLELSKEKVLKGRKAGRNQVSIFNNTLSWSDFEKVVKESKMLSSWVELGLLNRSDLWKLKNYHSLFSEFLYNSRVEGLKYKALLAYDIGRKKKAGFENKEVVEWLEGLFEITNPILIYLDVIVSYVLFSVRR